MEPIEAIVLVAITIAAVVGSQLFGYRMGYARGHHDGWHDALGWRDKSEPRDRGGRVTRWLEPWT